MAGKFTWAMYARRAAGSWGRAVLPLGLISALLLLPVVAGAGRAHAQGWPSRNVTIVVPFPPSGGADTLARILTTPLSRRWKQTVVIENRPGASGHIGAAWVARAAPDGHTLMMSSTASLDRNNIAQFAPVALVSASPYVVVVRPGLGVHSVRELVARAKAAPGKLGFGSSGNGSASHLTAELFKQVAAVDLLHVPYKGTGQAVSDLLGGSIDLMFSPAQTVMPHVKAGRLIALAVTSDRRALALPDLPTVAESGVPGYAAVGWFGLLAPAATSRSLIERIALDVAAAMKESDVASAMLAAGAEPAEGTPDQFGRFVENELDKWSALEARLGSSGTTR
jgi:tripartite-type tricarboxylate transporter receptor subunit TctC